jgi:hypothetical protein
MKKILFAVILLCEVFIFGPLQAGAAIIKIDFTAHVSGFSGLTEFATDAPVEINDTVVGSWSYDTNAPLDSWGNYDDPNISFHFSIASSKGGLIFNYDGTNPDLTINTGWSSSNILVVSDHTRSSTDGSITSTQFTSSYPGSMTGWVPITGLMFSDSISGSPLPVTLDNLFWHLQYDVRIPYSESPYYTWTGGGIYCNVDSAQFSGGSPVPEPSTILLLGGGLAGVGLLRRRFKN